MKSTKILKVINNLTKVLPLAIAEDHLDMDDWRVNKHGYECGTTHCHAGWYAVAACNTKMTLDYENGINKMVRDLGFKKENELTDWLKENRKIWGNKDGDGLFANKDAFYHKTKRRQGAETLQHIVDHWTEVYNRVKKLETKSQENEVA